MCVHNGHARGKVAHAMPSPKPKPKDGPWYMRTIAKSNVRLMPSSTVCVSNCVHDGHTWSVVHVHTYNVQSAFKAYLCVHLRMKLCYMCVHNGLTRGYVTRAMPSPKHKPKDGSWYMRTIARCKVFLMPSCTFML